MNFANYFVAGLMAHLFADWFLQNEWMATYKTSLKHPAAWVHSGIHFLCALFAFSLPVALFVAITHLLIDTRVPLQKWRVFYGQTTEGAVMVPFAMWQDQAAHLLVLGVAARMMT